MWVWFAVALASDAPGAVVTWKGADAVLTVVAPLGEHVAPEPTGSVVVTVGDREISYVGPGAWLAEGVSIGDVRGQHVTARVEVGVCRDVGGACRMASADTSGSAPPIRKGALQLVPSAGAPEPAHPSPFRRDATADVEAALRAAAAEGGVVLLDFTAVWCPPCNLLSAEVLHAPDAEEILSGVRVVAVDVDDPASWALKDRYAVGGYPTVVAVDGTGAEIDRFVGYEGRDETIRWIAEVSDGTVPDAVPDAAPEETAPELAAKAAIHLLTRDDADAAAPWLARADEAPDLVDTHLAHFLAEPTVADATWLLDHAPERTSEWVMGVTELGDEGRSVAERALTLALREASAAEAADLLYLAAELAPEGERPLRYAAAAATLSAAFTGDPTLDRAHVTFLASLRASSGDVDGAVALLDEYKARFPDEPTWDLSASGVLREAGRLEPALERAQAASALAWGDTRLRAAKAQCETLKALGRTDDARAVASAALDEQPAPADGVDVRTHRYRAALEAFLAP
jgi:thiol-disulfide isomerase/thioredoxin